MIKIAIFNQKGGVSKTTTCYHLGWAMAEAGKRVLMVDADSQCNLTRYALGEGRYQKYRTRYPEDNIHDGLSPAFQSKTTLIQPVNCPEIRENLFLLPGHLDFTEDELPLSAAMHLSSSFGSMENLPGALDCLVRKTAENLDIAYVLFDMHPSLSAVNQDIFICCDYFMIPMNADSFSMMALQSLTRTLPAWERWAKKARVAFRETVYPLPHSTPKFLGYTVNYLKFREKDGRPLQRFREALQGLSEGVETNLVPALEKESMTLPKEAYAHAAQAMKAETRWKVDWFHPYDSYCMAMVPDFKKLAELSFKQSRPVFEVRNEKSGELENPERQQEFGALYHALSGRVLRLTADEP
ncbi:MAG: ParA family protein [Oscillospiraceae bacterium]|nr:ParA family protein [Oscillospiraceae bacterium]